MTPFVAIFILFSAPCLNSFADPTPSIPVKEALDKVKSAGLAPHDCPDCIVEDQGDAKTRACDHPFESRCAKVQGDAKEKVDNTAYAIIKDGFALLVKKTGKSNLGELALAWLKEKGLTPSKPLTADEIKAFGDTLFQQSHGNNFGNRYSQNQDAISKVFQPKEFSPCSFKTEGIPDVSFSCGPGCAITTKDPRVIWQRYSAFTEKMRKMLADAHETSMAGLYRALQSQCDDGNDATKKLTQCKPDSLRKIRTDIGDAIVDGDKKKGEAVIRKIFDAMLPIFAQAYIERGKPSKVPDFTKPVSALPKDAAESSSLVDGFSSIADGYCSYLENDLKTPIQMKTTEFMQWASKSEPVIRHLEHEYYPPDRMERVKKIFESIKSREIAFLQGKIIPATAACLSKAQKERLLEESKKLPLVIPQPVPRQYFKNVKFGVSSLALEKGALLPEEMEEPEYGPLMDYNLGDFKLYDGYYTPKKSTGEKITPEYFYLSAGALRATDLDPAPSYQVISHEIGHKFGPRPSKENGYDLGCAYTALLKCFEEVFKTVPQQADETFADWMAAQVTGELLSDVKATKEREKQIDLALLGPCGWEERSASGPYNGDFHPDAFTRIDRIFGRNPAIRKLIGCPEKPYCSLQGKVNP